MNESMNSVSPRTAIEVVFLQMNKRDGEVPGPETYVFSNGVQQCCIQIEIALFSNGNPITLQEAGATLRLISYAGGAPLGEGTNASWKPSETRNLILPYWAVSWEEAYVRSCLASRALPDDADHPVLDTITPHEPGTEVCVRYVSAAAAGTMKVAVEVADRNGTIIAQSNWSQVPDNGYGDGNGKFNAWLELHAVPFHQPPIEAYGEVNKEEPYRLEDYLRIGSMGKGTRTYEQFISLTHHQKVMWWMAAFRRGDENPGFSVWQDNGETKYGTEWAITYVIPPFTVLPRFGPGRVVKLQPADYGSATMLTQLIDEYATSKLTDPTRLVIGQIMGNTNSHFCDKEGHPVEGHREEGFVLVDQFGCRHYLVLYLPNEFNAVGIRSYIPTAEDHAKSVEPRLFAAEANPGLTRESALAGMQLRVDHDTIRADGRAKARICLTLRARLGDQGSRPSEQELASIRLIDYDTCEPIPWGDDAWARTTSGWIVDEPSFTPVSSPDSPDVTLERYVSADGRARAPLRCAFSIRMGNGTIYRSNGLCSGDDDKQPVYDPTFVSPDAFTVVAEPVNDDAPASVIVNSLDIVPIHHEVLYNGRQQAVVELVVEARQDGKPAALTADEKASIRLLDYDARRPIPIHPSSGWSVQDVPGPYRHEHGPSSDRPSSPADIVYRYLVADGSPTPKDLKVAFEVTMRDGAVYASTGWCTAAGASTPQYRSEFDVATDIDVQAVEPPNYTPDDVQISERLPLPLTGEARAGIFNDVFSVSLMPTKRARIDILDVSCEPVGIIHWETRLADDRNPVFIGYARMGETVVNWHEAFSSASPPTTIPSSDKGAVMLVMCGRVNMTRRDVPDAPQGAVRFTAIDAYGNDVRFALAFKEGSRDTLVVS